MRALAPLLAAAALMTGPAAAQTTDHGATGGMDHGSMPGMDHAQAPGMVMPGPPGEAASEPAAPAAAGPDAPAPPSWDGRWAADRDFDPHAMAHARAMMRGEMGGVRLSKVMLDLAEFRTGGRGADGYRWDGQAWRGGDIHRLVLRSEGEGSRREGLEAGEVQALYSRAVWRYTDVQAGLRQDLASQGRTYVTAGVQSLFPYWFDVGGALFLSTRGELLARAEGTYDLRLTQRVVLQPRAELNLAAQDTAQTRTGAGLSSAELGLRLRYEVRREFAPYVGVSWERRFGRTADYWRAAGDAAESTTVVAGLRAWF